MKNKKFLYPLFALMFLVTIYSAVSFVPYDCNVSANVYDNFSDSSINLTLWDYKLVGAYSYITEANNTLILSAGLNAGQGVILKPNMTYKTESIFPFISEGGCLMIKGNFLKGAGTTSNTTFYLTNINNGANITIDVSIINNTNNSLIFWRKNNLIFYKINEENLTNITITPLYNYGLVINLGYSSATSPLSYYTLNNIWINQTNNILIKVYDELTGALITTPITLSMTNNISTTPITHTNSTFLSNFDRTTNFQISATNYDYRLYKNIVPNGSITFLNMYLLNISLTNSIETTFTIKNLKGDLIEGALMNITKILNGSVVTITSTTSDVAGIVHIYLDRTTPYTFYVNKEGYNLKTFVLYPTSYTYTITLNQNVSQMFNDTKGDISYEILPYSSTLTENSTQQFSLTTSSPSGYILNYGVYSGATKDNNTETTGGTATITKDTTSLSNTTINVYYFIQSQGGYMQINRSYFVYDAVYSENQTLVGIFGDLSTQINPFYRFLIALILSLVLGAGFFVLIGTNGATIIAWLSFMGFGVVGFIPWVFPLITGILIVLGFVVVGGNGET